MEFGIKITPFSGTLKVPSGEAAEQLNLTEQLGGPAAHYNAWAAAVTYVSSPTMPDDEFESIYNITKQQADQLHSIMYQT